MSSHHSSRPSRGSAEGAGASGPRVCKPNQQNPPTGFLGVGVSCPPLHTSLPSRTGCEISPETKGSSRAASKPQ